MRQHKRTYTLPLDALQDFEQVVAPGRRSALIADLMREWLDKRQRERLRREIIEGSREMAGVYLETEREYHPLEEEVHRALDGLSQTRRHRANPARSGRRLGAGGRTTGGRPVAGRHQ